MPVIITQAARRDRIARALTAEQPQPRITAVFVHPKDTNREGLCHWCGRRYWHAMSCPVHELTQPQGDQ